MIFAAILGGVFVWQGIHTGYLSLIGLGSSVLGFIGLAAVGLLAYRDI